MNVWCVFAYPERSTVAAITEPSAETMTRSCPVIDGVAPYGSYSVPFHLKMLIQVDLPHRTCNKTS